MIDLDEINKEIEHLEKYSLTTYGNCYKLASLYIVRDHLKDKKEVKKTKEEPAMPTVPMMK